MNTFFRIAIFICLFLIVVNLGWSFIRATGAFPDAGEAGISGAESNDVFYAFTGFAGGMAGVFAVGASLGAIGAGLVSWAVKSTTPMGVYLFSIIFWSSYNSSLNIMSVSHIPGSMQILITVGIMFVFVGAIIGMLTGSG